MTNTLTVVVDRIWQRRLLVVAVALVVLFGAFLTAQGESTTYTSRVLVSAGSTRPPTQDAILAQGYTYYLNDPTYQANLKQTPGFPTDIYGFSAEFVTGSPLFVVQVTAATPEAAKDAAPKVTQAYVDDVNDRLDASRNETTADMTAAMMKVWGDRLAEGDPNAFSAQVQLQQQIDHLNSDQSNRLTIMQSSVGATAQSPGTTRDLATALVGGLLLGCVVALLAGAATRRLYTDYDVVEKTGVRTFDVIPAGGTPARDARREVTLRHLANLIARSNTELPTSVAVVPVSAGVGGDRIARAIAEHRAAQGARAILVNADLRGGDGSGQPGVAEYLRGPISDVWDLATSRGPAGFAEIATGQAGSDPYRLFDRGRVRALIDAIGEIAELAIILVPPISTAPESQIVADLADSTVLVIERGQTTARDVHDAVRAVNQVGAQVLGAVLVDTADRRGPLPRWARRSRPDPAATAPLPEVRTAP
ncbi:hypothetical protein HLB23_13125 [Nocardia uniformis]|uniref:Mrp family chromosome partitioning ATPase n=1 Tax=Nocardia uniformis TaxID=53432 RepID=A0A849C033_9NOCA|nr:hypothetical protein [Nocardia uniformis]NNH70796.1 hypothetical protein [Nocardia uniformis]